MLETMERVVLGSFPQILKKYDDVNLNQTFSLISLSIQSGNGEGATVLLAIVMFIFLVVMPILRAILQFIGLYSIPVSYENTIKFISILGFIGCFCAIEVFFVALILVQIEMPSLTNNIIPPDSTICQTLNLAGYEDFCLKIYFNILPNGAYFIIATIITISVYLFLTETLKTPMNDFTMDCGKVFCCDCCCVINKNYNDDEYYDEKKQNKKQHLYNEIESSLFNKYSNEDDNIKDEKYDKFIVENT